jgi:hypothetical protein
MKYRMKKKAFIFILVLIGLIPGPLTSIRCQYIDNNQMAAKIAAIGTQYPELCSVRSLIRTIGGNNVWLITIGTGSRDSKPGIAIVGGVDGKYIFSREIAAGFAETMLENSSEKEVRELLDKITFYVLPDVNPDASAQFSARLKYERSLNSRSVDDDRDFATDEDPFEDLNNDGLITLIRINDPAGNYIESDEDKRIMVPADISKGQTGKYLVYSEGTDNDKDRNFNEDGAGGVNFNNNFTYNYEEFGLNAGPYPVSEPECKAVADFLYDRFNIYAVFTFGPQDNLGQPMKSPERPSATQDQHRDQAPEQGMMRRQRGKITSILKTDELINKLVSDKYHEITGLKGAPAATSEPGNFMEWAYFHYGRYSFGTPGWWLPVEKGKSAEAAFLKFADKSGLKDVFVPWTEIVHPDFPGKKTEVGGIKPFALINPPSDTIVDLISSHYKFITAIAAMHPELEILDTRVEDAGENIFRLTLKIHNKGVFATCSEIGDDYIWTRIMRIAIEPSKGQVILSGLKVQRIQRLQGDESAEFIWLISGKGRIGITAGAANVGQISTSVELK